MVDGFTKTPRYVLKGGAHPSGPSVLKTSSDAQFTVIFGFSDKPEYDLFLKTSPVALTPYPLVKGYLKNQSDLEGDPLQLIVLDATSSQQRTLDAATFQSVLQAFQLNSDLVAISHQLVRDESSPAYRIQTSADVTSDSSRS